MRRNVAADSQIITGHTRNSSGGTHYATQKQRAVLRTAAENAWLATHKMFLWNMRRNIAADSQIIKRKQSQ